MRFLLEKEINNNSELIFSSNRERCVNCQFLDARLICALNFTKAGDESKYQIVDPENQVCDNFIAND